MGLWALAMACGLWLVTTGVAVHSELADLLPEGTTATQRLLLTQVRTGRGRSADAPGHRRGRAG